MIGYNEVIFINSMHEQQFVIMSITFTEKSLLRVHVCMVYGLFGWLVGWLNTGGLASVISGGV